MSESSDKLQVGAYFMLAGGFILSALANIKNARDKALGNVNAHGLGESVGEASMASGKGPRVLQLPSVRLPTSLGKPKLKQYDVRDIDTRVGLIGELIRKGSLSPDLRERTVALLASKCDALGRLSDDAGRWCVAEKDCLGEVKAIFEAIRNPRSKYAVRYTRDAMLADVFVAPERTLLKSHGGDCFVQGTKVLKQAGHALVPIESLREGDVIWGYNKWTRVTKVFGDKGILKTWLVRLNNGSSMRLTPDHKVWIADRAPHEVTGEFYEGGKSDGKAKRKRPPVTLPDSQRITNIRTIYLRDLKEGDIVLQPDRVDYGTGTMDPDTALIEGFYLSDGWTNTKLSHFSIAGQDGCPKEAQKRRVQEICERLGIKTSWARKDIRVRSREWAQRLATFGSHAPQKHAPSIDFEQPVADKLCEGIMADSGMNSCGKTRTFTTTSRELWLQTRVLLKQQGITCSERYIVDHGGLGKNPIWRLQTRVPPHLRDPSKKQGNGRLLMVKEIIKDETELPCWDIETEDHFVWLPEADWTTRQCDDYVVLLGSMLMSVGHPVRMRVVATRQEGVADSKAPWSHIYLLTPTTFDNPNAKWTAMWLSVDGSMDKPLGWEAPGAREVAATGKPSGIIARVRDYSLMKPSDAE
jgi:hypothetical protein